MRGPWICEDMEAGEVTEHATQADALRQAEACIKEWMTEDGIGPEAENIYVYRLSRRAKLVRRGKGYSMKMVPIAKWKTGWEEV